MYEIDVKAILTIKILLAVLSRIPVFPLFGVSKYDSVVYQMVGTKDTDCFVLNRMKIFRPR